MRRHTTNQYEPEIVSLPGETLVEVLADRGMTQADLARRAGRPAKTINEIVQGKAAIEPATALQLERVLGVPAGFWNNLETNYRAALARESERDSLASEVAWLKRVPVRELIKRGWIGRCKEDVQQLLEVLSFFGVASPRQWKSVFLEAQASYRRPGKFKSDAGALAAWMRRGEILAQAIDCEPYDEVRFREVLASARKLTLEKPALFVPELQQLCAAAGVAVVFVPELAAARISGACRWTSPERALIQLSLRYKRDDQLWFSFFHEAGHVVLHGVRDVFLEDDERPVHPIVDLEQEADRFAADLLIPPDAYSDFKATFTRRTGEVQKFARKLGIAPGIVVGRLQHDLVIPHASLNGLKVRLEWAADGGGRRRSGSSS